MALVCNSSRYSGTPTQAVLCLDLGTRATKATLAHAECGIFNHPVIVPRPDLRNHDQVFDNGDFPSGADLFAVKSSPKDCTGFIDHMPDLIPASVSLHIVFIKILRDAGSDKTHERDYRSAIPQLDSFFDRFDGLDKDMQDTVMAHVRDVFIAHLQLVRRRAQLVTESRGWQIKRVAATIPSYWGSDRWVRKVYSTILGEIWNDVGSEDIIFLHESEAIVHWLLRLNQKTQNERPRQLIIADFGGHILGHTVHRISYSNDDKDNLSFFLTSLLKGCAPGGSELYACFLKQRMRDEIGVKQKDPQSSFQDFMHDYYRKCHKQIKPSKFFIGGWTSDDDGDEVLRIDFDDSQSKELYEACIEKPLEQLDSLLTENEGLAEKSVVVLCGGTFRIPPILANAKQKVEQEGLRWYDLRRFTTEMECSSTVAVGAAMALVKAISVEDFMSRAAFSVIMTNAKQNRLPVIWNRGESQEATLDLRGQQDAEVWIVCCPFPSHKTAPFANAKSAFKFQPLPERPEGNYRISLDYKKRDTRRNLSDRLLLTIKPDSAGSSADVDTVEWPVYYDVGSCVISVDIDEVGDTRSTETCISFWKGELYPTPLPVGNDRGDCMTGDGNPRKRKRAPAVQEMAAN